jgi:hypothetical protein
MDDDELGRAREREREGVWSFLVTQRKSEEQILLVLEEKGSNQLQTM